MSPSAKTNKSVKTEPEIKGQKMKSSLDRKSIENIPEINSKFFENSLDAMMIGSQDGQIYAANPAACRMLGFSEKEICNLGRKGMVEQNQQLAEAVRKRKESGNFFGELTYIKKDGTRFPVEVSSTVFIHSDSTEFTTIIIRDISERKKGEQALKESEEKFHTLFESMRQGVFYQTINGKFTDVNQSALSMFGITKEEFFGRTSYNVEWKVIDEKGTLLKPEEHPSMIALLTGKPVKDITTGVFNPIRNQYTWAITNAIPEFRSENDKPYQVFVTMHDITDKKNTEDALAKRESELRIIHENIEDIVWKLDKDTRITYISPSVKKLLDYEVEYLIGKPILEFIAKEYHQSAKKIIQNRLVSGKSKVPAHFQYEMIAKDGSRIPIEVSSNPIWNNDGSLLGYTGVTRNITERKQVEKALITSEEKFRVLTEKSLIGFYIIQDGKFAYVNPACAYSLGYLPEEIIGILSPEDLIYQDDIQVLMKRIQERLAGKIENQNILYRAVKKDGSLIYIEVYGNSIYFQDRLAIIGSMIDVTERVTAEEKLRTSEAEFRSLFDNSIMGISLAHPGGKFIRMNKAYAEMYGYPDPSTMLRELAQGSKILYANPDDRKKVLKILGESGFMAPTEFELNRRNGEKFWALVSARQVKDSDGKLLYLQAEHIDITGRKKLEKEMYSASLYVRNLIEASLDPLVTINAEGKITDVNLSTEKISGVPRKKLIGSDFADYFSDPEKARKVYKKVFSEGVVKDYPLTIINKNGKEIDVLYNATLFKDEAGKVQGVFAAARDVTNQKKMEEELRKSKDLLEKLNQHLLEVRENERNQIALNLHDDLGQKLTAINLDIAWLKSRIGVQSKTVNEKFEEMSSMIKETVESIRETSSLLRPAILFDLGLVPAIKSQLGKFEKQTGIKCHFNFKPEEFKLEERLALILYRILQESLTNIARHSGASETEIELYIRRNKIEMIISDNGTGISKNKVNSLSSMGIAGMKERVRSVNGKIIIMGNTLSGTRIKVMIPFIKEKGDD